MTKKAVVTGAGHGIGKAIALDLAKNGHDLCITYCHDSAGAEDTCRQIEAMGRTCTPIYADMSVTEDLPKLFDALDKQFPRIDVWVNNAGVTKYCPFLEVDQQMLDLLINIDWKGAFFGTQYAAKKMIEQKIKGSIINITSIHRRINYPAASVYGPVKMALYKFTQHAALELAPYGIRVNSISPGYIKVTDPSVVTEREKMMVSRIPAGRIGQPPEIAAMVRFLISEDATYITGRDFGVDGGAPLPATIDNVYFDKYHAPQ